MALRRAEVDMIDHDGVARPAHGLPGNRHHVFQERHASRQVAAIGEVARDGFRRTQQRPTRGVRSSPTGRSA